MHYHSRQRGPEAFRIADRITPGDTILPTSPSTSHSTDLPLPGAEDGSSQFDRMEAQVKTLHQQAVSTQQKLQHIKLNEAPGPTASLVSELRGMPSLPFMPSMDMAMAGALLALTAATAAVWWFFRHRPNTKRFDLRQSPLHNPTSPAAPPPMPTVSRPPVRTEPMAQAPVQKSQAVRESTLQTPAEPAYIAAPAPVPAPENRPQKPTPPGAVLIENQTIPTPIPASNLRTDAGFGFNSKAAATEVQRVRKSLAVKREARSLLREYDEELSAHPNPAPAASTVHTDFHSEVHAVLPSELQHEPEFDLSEAEVPTPVAHSLSGTDVAVDQLSDLESGLSISLGDSLDLGMEAFEPIDETRTLEPQSDLEPEVVVLGPDWAITLALAQESAALELWPEARDLANEVMECGDATLQAQAQALLDEVAAREQVVGEMALLPEPTEES